MLLCHRDEKDWSHIVKMEAKNDLYTPFYISGILSIVHR